MIHALAVAVALAAAPAQPAAGASPEVKEAPLAAQVARELVTAELWARTLDGLAAQYAAQIRTMAQQGGGDADAGLEAALRGLYEEFLPYAEIIDLQASLLAKHFDAGELVQLRDLYRTPLGRKMLERMPELQKDAVALTFERLNGRMGMKQFQEVLGPHFRKPADAEPAAPEAAPQDAAKPAATP